MNSNTLVNCFAAEFRIYIIVILSLPSMNTFEPSNDYIYYTGPVVQEENVNM